MKQSNLSLTRDIFMQLGIARIYLAVTFLIMLVMTLIQFVFPDMSNISCIVVAFAVLFVTLRYVLQRTNEYLPESKIKISSTLTGGRLVEIHQTTRSLILQMMSNIPGAAKLIRPIRKMRLSREILYQCVAATAYAINERGVKTVYIKSHLLNHEKARRKMKEMLYSQISGMEIAESNEKITFILRMLLALTLKRKLKAIPKIMKVIEVRAR